MPDAGLSFGEWIAGTKRYYGSGEFLSDISLALPTIFSGSSAQCEGRRFVPSSSRSVPDLQSHPFLRTPNDLCLGSRIASSLQEVGFFEGPDATGAGEFTSKVSTDPITVANTLGMVLGPLGPVECMYAPMATR